MKFHPILLEVAEQLETDRLILRAPQSGDGAAHFAAVQESSPDLRRHLTQLPWVRDEPSLANSERHCRVQRSNFIRRESLVYFMFTRTDLRFIGAVGLHRIDWDVPKMEIGYWCRSSAQGNGYVVEAVRFLTEFAFSQLQARRVALHADNANTKSWKVAEACGFQLEGVLRQFDRNAASGDLNDLRVYSRIASA